MKTPRREHVAGALGVAVALSVLVHIIGGFVLYHFRGRGPSNEPHEVVQKVTLINVVHLHPTPPPPTPTPEPTQTPVPTPTPEITPTPTPPPVTPPPVTPPPETPKPVHHEVSTPAPVKHAAPPHLHLNVPQVHSHQPNAATEGHADNAPGTENGTTAGTGAAGAGSGTGNEPVGAAPTEAACAHPEAEARVVSTVEAETPEDANGASGTAKVAVHLSAASEILKVEIYQSSGNAALDREALTNAEHDTYKAAVHDCQPVPGVYILRVGFDAQSPQ